MKKNFSNHIHITGEARSGTTLMKNLFRCFEDTVVVVGETNPDLSEFFQGTPMQRQEILDCFDKNVITKLPYACSREFPFTMDRYPGLKKVLYTTSTKVDPARNKFVFKNLPVLLSI